MKCSPRSQWGDKSGRIHSGVRVAGGGSTAILAFVGKLKPAFNWPRSRFGSGAGRPKIPRTKLVLVAAPNRTWWTRSDIPNEAGPSIYLDCRCTITNAGAYAHVVHAETTIRGDVLPDVVMAFDNEVGVSSGAELDPQQSQDAHITLVVGDAGQIRTGEPIIGRLVLVDQFGLRHRSDKLRFRPVPPRAPTG
jgi:hypothetical protein